MELFYEEIDSPLGPLLIVMEDTTVIRIDYGSYDELDEFLFKWTKRYLPESVFIRNQVQVEEVVKELLEYFEGKRHSFTFRFKFYGTAYQKSVWRALLTDIPYGETKTYKDIAIAIANPKSVRAVGGAVNKNPFSIVVPCHRVIGQNGKMVGYNGGLDKKQFLLNHEQL